MTKLLLLACALSALLSACSTPPTTQRSECEHISNMLEYDNCMRRANAGSDTVQKAKYK
jgi:starvation-inducible outer membrane lipoprotein